MAARSAQTERPSGQTGRYGGRSTADRVAERRRRLLDATLTVWADPATRVTMTGVCAEAQLTERYFYESFAGLDDALGCVLEEIAAEIERRTEAAVDGAGEDPHAQVRASLLAFVELMAEDPRTGRVALIESAAMPALRGRRTELLRHFARRSAQEARARLDMGSSARESELAGLMFIGGLAELITAWLDGGLEATPEEIVTATTRMFLGLNR